MNEVISEHSTNKIYDIKYNCEFNFKQFKQDVLHSGLNIQFSVQYVLIYSSELVSMALGVANIRD